MSVDKEAVLAQLRAEDVAAHLGIKGSFRGRWMRSKRCGETDHSSDVFGLARDGRWHCHACNTGGDLLKLLALGSGVNISTDFPKVLEIAAGIAGVEDEDSFVPQSKPAPRERPPLPPDVPIAKRISIAKRRAAWLWERLREDHYMIDAYLRSRGLRSDLNICREDLRTTPLNMPRPAAGDAPELVTCWRAMQSIALVIPVRSVDDGAFVDLRCRRMEPGPDEPKIIGMLGSVTSAPADSGHARRLIGCYGHPESVDSDLVVVVEGAMDYLTALQVWPNAQCLGAVESGSMALVAQHAARQLARRDNHSRMIIVEQYDPPRTLRNGDVVPGAADSSINEEPNAAMKVAHRHLGPSRVGWVRCAGAGIKDLNDMVQASAVNEPAVDGVKVTLRFRAEVVWGNQWTDRDDT